jgi:toxin ParE1/3/4
VDHNYVLRPLAEQDLADIWSDGADKWGMAQSDRYFDGIIDLFEGLSVHPEMARLRHEFTPAVRLHRYGAHIVIFEKFEAGISIIRVLHQRRDIIALLGV